MKKLVTISLFILLFLGCARNPNLKQPTELTPLPKIESTPFILGVGDEMILTVWRNNDLNSTRKISPDGTITFPLIGTIKASGKSVPELKKNITERLDKYLVSPQVGLSVASTRSQKVFVLGEVNKPGVFRIEDSMDVLEALTLAGGFTINAEEKSVLLIRGGMQKPELGVLDMQNLFKGENLNSNVSLQKGDVLYVSRNLISDVERYFKLLRTIISPILAAESAIILYPAVEDTISGGESSGRSILSIPAN